jgi:uncharacterized membrane protein YfcA
MVILIIEIILTVNVWRKGWKWKALIPIASFFTLGFLIGVTVTLAGGQVNVLVLLPIDLLCIFVLIVMSNKSPQKKQSPKKDQQPKKDK